jgi:flavorubredoxin
MGENNSLVGGDGIPGRGIFVDGQVPEWISRYHEWRSEYRKRIRDSLSKAVTEMVAEKAADFMKAANNAVFHHEDAGDRQAILVSIGDRPATPSELQFIVGVLNEAMEAARKERGEWRP